MAELSPKQIAEMKKLFEAEAKKSAASKAKVAESLKQVAALQGASSKMKAENSKETD